MENKDNYQALRDEWKKKFLSMDHVKLAERFHLKIDDEKIYVTYYSHPFTMDRKTGDIVRLDAPKKAIGFDTALLFYNMFYYAVPNPTPSGNLVPFREVRRVYPFEPAYKNSTLKHMAERFNGKVNELRHACEVLGGKPIAQGDVGYVLESLPGLGVAVIFWDGDDEFPAQANMLFDYNITDFMHEENVVSVAADALYYLTEVVDGENAITVYSKNEEQ
ncbi:hypothetical protein P261_01383 [Lachnospiraceae bacterium TWA4]|nr:hypothetical protein P261_01383 [Lachnospiraceae bacterium TWA4]